MLAFRCAKCRTNLQRQDADAGTQILCPGCSQELLVPTPPRLADKTMLGALQPADTRTLVEEVKRRVAVVEAQPFRVAVMGQTGVGKSSLLNACFGTDLKTDPVRPCTREVSEPVKVRNEQGHELWFYDLPGVGESEHADAGYLDMYLHKLVEADVVLWLIHADSRSVEFDRQCRDLLFSRLPTDERAAVVNKVTYVLSKADLIFPPPWVCGREGDVGHFVPHPRTAKLLEAKDDYIAEVLLHPLADELRSMTHLTEPWAFNDSRFAAEPDRLTFRGLMTRTVAGELKQRYPAGAEVIDRLLLNHRVIPCSARLRYNLYQVLVAVVSRISPEANRRFMNFLSEARLNEVPFAHALGLCNLLVVDNKQGKLLFDLARQRF